MTKNHILVVMAGFFRAESVPALSQCWIDALISNSQKLVLVFDNYRPNYLPAKWESDNIDVIFERHGEYDFGSYKRGLMHARAKGWLDQSTHVLLCNDSVIGPLADLRNVFEVVCGAADHVYGLTISYQIRPHLQSFFLMMGRDIFLNPSITSFFDNVRPQSNRYAVIQKYEIGFSSLLLKAGYELRSFVPIESCVDPRNGELMGNPMAYPVSMVHLGVPIVKTRALRDVNANLNGFSSLLRLIAKTNPCLWKLLSNDFDYRRLWQYSLQIGLILAPDQLSQLRHWLEWLEVCPHPNCSLILPLTEEFISIHARQFWVYRDAIENGKLQIVPLEDSIQCQDFRELLFLAALSTACDWIAQADSDLFNCPGKIAVQVHQAMQYPLAEKISGTPLLLQRHQLLNRRSLPPN